MAIETPKYTIIKKDGQVELRAYEAYITASVRIKADSYNAASTRAFSILADYIFGNNTVHTAFQPTGLTQNALSEQISMTAPVRATKEKRSEYVVSFTMPSRYNMSTLPKPNSPAVQLLSVPAHQAIVIRFSGYTTDKKIDEFTNRLRQWTALNNLQTVGTETVSRYDPPWKPGIIRRNEISYHVKTL